MRLLVVSVLFLCSLQCGAAQRLQRGNQEQLNPCKERGGIAPHIDYCDRYFECDAGVAYEVDCPNGLVYSGKHGMLDNCDYPNENPFSCRKKQRANPAIATENCRWLYGIFSHEESCTRYWTCWNGTANEQFCLGGLLFNEATNGCDWPQNVEGCQQHPLCVEDANGNTPLGNSCERYWSCLGGYPRLMRCPATLVFEKRTRRCVYPPTEDCEAPPSEPPPSATEAPPRPGSRGRRPLQQAPQQIDRPAEQASVEYYDYDYDPLAPGDEGAN